MSTDPELERWLSTVRQCKFLNEDDMKALCDRAQQILMEEANVHPVSTPVSVCGDIHGQFWDLLELLRIGGEPPNTNYIFMGDFVDRGYYSLETITLLLCLKVKFPEKVFLLRGNHESRQVSQIYGFYEECQEKYGTALVWNTVMQLFDVLTIAVVRQFESYE
eukprot:TRINITY_DN3739_c0_g1_i7.p1 TRINITY_DN3739_c0_g1~~TRINITY_DN3739_c0_g1_i7.p1  ORF type:complete len:163 (-),score=28.97 TRINITY_DN3739_c0_g1_i7:245-733(-)